ncbi:ankyrin repeat domain-containing protein [Candidatus Babeliales bacterium]|nr:ankyrin repeat domain-containing protein [Candidatus Babeliales bacterium]
MKKLFIFFTVLSLSFNLSAMQRSPKNFDWAAFLDTPTESSSSSRQPSAEPAPSFGGMRRADKDFDWASFRGQAPESSSSSMIVSEQLPVSASFVPSSLPVAVSKEWEQSALHNLKFDDSDCFLEQRVGQLPNFGASSQPSTSSSLSSQYIMPNLDDLEIEMPSPVLSPCRLRTPSPGTNSILSKFSRRSPNSSRSPSPLPFLRTATPFTPGSSSPSSLSSGKSSPDSGEIECMSLHEAIFCSKNDLVVQFIQKSADPNELDALTGKTPLHVAVEADNVYAISILLAAGANTNLMDKNGYTPAHLAEVLENPDIIALFPKPAVTVPSTSSKQRSKNSNKHSKKRSKKRSAKS